MFEYQIVQIQPRIAASFGSTLFAVVYVTGLEVLCNIAEPVPDGVPYRNNFKYWDR